ncbi:DgyrCDS9976 [Dimorphilus gyrociliatus]|uniref:DgyrCDS9976 n=1 Tax=Dimorphilus gyrociliatus TaxID=2664684 RepID=A0A7I8W3X5_9ANNE|nr:DgyrCDS9976 [Dimorphilus gyrociliatus]
MSEPKTTSELQLYKILQRANLLSYYDVFISQGGDDVRQLVEAGEEEFLEIMALVGMASKPLHVRRLQKALHEWASFNRSPTVSRLPSTYIPSVPSVGNKRLIQISPVQNIKDEEKSNDSNPESDDTCQTSCTIELSTEQAIAIERSATNLASKLPQFAPKMIQMKKPFGKELEDVLRLPSVHPEYMSLLRRHSAIYIPNSSEERNDSRLTIYQVLTNEAAAQLCKHRPALVTRRDDLFPLAKRVVKDACKTGDICVTMTSSDSSSSSGDEDPTCPKKCKTEENPIQQVGISI